MTELSKQGVRRGASLAAVFAVLMLVGQLAEAGPHRARLSKDLEARLASGSEETTRVIVSGTDAEVDALAVRYGARRTKSVRGGAVLEVTGGQLAGLAADQGVTHLSSDARVERMMAVTTESTGATQIWSGIAGLRGFSGRGIGVAVIDSGVAQHAALRGHIVAAFDLTEKPDATGDRFGHGTHVAGIIAGSDGDYAGVAPGAHIVSLRVLGKDGSGATSDVINAIDFAIANKAKYSLRVINLSLGHPVYESYRDDPLCQAVQRAVDAGLIVVAAAGNLGKTPDGRPIVGGVISPGNTPAALTVGAVNTRATAVRSDDVMATYSSRGPSAVDGVLKPDLAAPGNKIVAPAAPGSYLAQTYPERIVSGQGSKAYIELSGTSMASAVVAGAVALLLEANPALTPAEAKLVLQVTSSRVDGAGLIEAGAGSLNIAAAVMFARGQGEVFGATVIANEVVRPSRVTFVDPNGGQFAQQCNGTILVWGSQLKVSADILVWGSSLVWGNILVWGNAWVTADILVWGSSVEADILVWGNILVWGSTTVEADILVWGDVLTSAD
jgi:serine protease AprX